MERVKCARGEGCCGWVYYVIKSSSVWFPKKSGDWGIKQYVRSLGIRELAYEIVFPSQLLQNGPTILNVFSFPLQYLPSLVQHLADCILDACIFLNLGLWPGGKGVLKLSLCVSLTDPGVYMLLLPRLCHPSLLESLVLYIPAALLCLFFFLPNN